MPRTRKGTRIYIYDLEDGSIEQVDVGEPVPTQTKSKNASISGDGKLVTFLTTGSFVSSDTNNNASDIYIATPSNVCPVLQ